MPRIAVVTTVSATMDAFLVDVMRQAHENGYYVTLCCSLDSDFVRRNSDFARFLSLPLTRQMNPLRFLWTVVKLFKHFRSNYYDIVQYSTPIASLAASLAATAAGVPVRLYCQWGIRYVGYSGLSRVLFKASEKLTCLLSTWIEPDSHGNREFSIKEALYGPQKSSVIGHGSANGVDLVKFDSAQRELWSKQVRTELGLTDDAFVLGFVGRVTRDKGVNEILRACRASFREFSNIHLLIAGPLEEVRTLDPTLVQWANNSDRVALLGRRADVHKVMASFDVLLLPSYREGFGSVVIEAASLGVPAIVSNIPGPTDAVRADETGLIVAKADDVALQQAIEFMVRNPERCSAMGWRAMGDARAFYDREKFTMQVLEDRNRLINRGGHQ